MSKHVRTSADKPGAPPGATDFDAILAFGSNIGDKEANVARAIGLVEAAGDVEVVARSRNYRTPPWGVTEQDWFVNACAAVATKLSPHELLLRCQGVEAEMKRVRRQHWGPRIIDVDILVHRDGAVTLPDLMLPHPRITERAFVLAPLAEIAPDLEINGRTARDWLQSIDRRGVEPIGTQ